MTGRQKSTMLALLATLAMATPAQAGIVEDLVDTTGETLQVKTTAETTESCTDPQVAPLLQDHGDDDMYFVAPGGDFEDGAKGWQLERGASIGWGSSAFAPLGAGQRSLELPYGAAATSPAFCVDERFPHFRVAVGQLGSRKARIRVSVVYPGIIDNVRKEADVDAESKQPWKLSKPLMIKSEYGRKKNGWRLVALRFELVKAESGSDARIDDVLVDPRLRY